MKKLVLIIMMAAVWSNAALAETIVVVDSNGYVTQQIYTQNPTVVSQPAPQQVVVTQPVYPQTVVVQQRPEPRNYYYDSTATAFWGGVAGITIGSLLFHPHHHHHHHYHGHHGGHHRR